MKNQLVKKLSNGIEMPVLGLGTFRSQGDEVYHAVITALKAGYRHIDTAVAYDNEQMIGKAIKDSAINRKEIFITTKVWCDARTYDDCINTINNSLSSLGVDYIDLLLIHWPKDYQRNIDVWRAMEDYYDKGIIKAIGVSNFQIHHLNNLIVNSRYKPVMNQVELHPGLQQINMEIFCAGHNISLTSYGPLMKGQVFEMPQLKTIADKYNKSIVNVIVRWGIQRGVFMIPKSVTTERIIENFNVFDFELTEEDMQQIRKLNIARRVYSDPDNIDFGGY